MEVPNEALMQRKAETIKGLPAKLNVLSRTSTYHLHPPSATPHAPTTTSSVHPTTSYHMSPTRPGRGGGREEGGHASGDTEKY